MFALSNMYIYYVLFGGQSYHLISYSSTSVFLLWYHLSCFYCVPTAYLSAYFYCVPITYQVFYKARANTAGKKWFLPENVR